jgi:lycopene cyclase domain-containing protein
VTYTAAVALGLVAALTLDLFVLRTRLVLGWVFWISYGIILICQVAANGVLTGLAVVRYDPSAILGLRLAFAPVEDLVFGFALVLSTLAIWSRLRPRDQSDRSVGGGLGQRGEHLDGAVGERDRAERAQ